MRFLPRMYAVERSPPVGAVVCQWPPVGRSTTPRRDVLHPVTNRAVTSISERLINYQIHSLTSQLQEKTHHVR
ncbi:hypothetical protein [Brasilonema octagenarum]|uniref:hypothetical protein n=1 Tax=Brasilonema octagenarum TaxID=417105 RepID=UPI00145F5C6B|nr:hypothetical protein [Brasilonema octagenarum]